MYVAQHIKYSILFYIVNDLLYTVQALIGLYSVIMVLRLVLYNSPNKSGHSKNRLWNAQMIALQMSSLYFWVANVLSTFCTKRNVVHAIANLFVKTLASWLP